ncbi:hypothetical protein Tco_1106727 [Tanacetum coccineum]
MIGANTSPITSNGQDSSRRDQRLGMLEVLILSSPLPIYRSLLFNIDYREESETEEESGESEEESSNEDKGIEDDSEDKIESNISHLLKKGTDIKKLDWCGYLLKCLKRTKTLWNGALFNGPLTFLTVLYAQKCMPMVLKRSSTAINVAKTTPEKERVTKSKIIAAKNAVSQSPIKAVNLGDISRKSYNGISNTPKDVQNSTFVHNILPQNPYLILCPFVN